MTDIIDELHWRGLIAQSTDEDALRARLAEGPITVYAGFDPTAESLHAGNLVPLLALRRFQRAGHRAVVLAGGATGLVGDPSGRASERSLNTPERVRELVEGIKVQLSAFVDFDGPNPAILVNNLDWTAPMSALEFLRDVGKHFTVNQMLAKESVSARLNGEGISYTEFSYMLLQSNDYLHLYRDHGCELQIGGSDQWGNITAGLDLIRKVTGGRAHALTVPLITNASGEKFGKSTGGGRLWLDPELTSPYAWYQYWINADDRDVVNWLRTFTFLDRDEVEALAAETAERPFARAAQRRLAEELTTLVHGKDETAKAIAASQALFGRGDLSELDPATLGAALREAGALRVEGALPSATALLAQSGLAKSLSDARRTVAEGGAYLNNVKVTDGDVPVAESELLHGRWLVLRKGKKTFAGVELVR
ncbi:MAG: tyrosyl-tRNA synthetase [Actinomycetia bacterium]|nr:tyrosyl-tRNA synthetase [Actinomycetes bacterium]MDQ1655211.1 tyrosyl-tRNA synthetase [Cryptosporangiaceae bacterium]